MATDMKDHACNPGQGPASTCTQHLPRTSPPSNKSAARFITLLTVQRLSEMLSPTLRRQNPWAIGHRRLVTHVLTMATLEIRHPIAILIQMIADNDLMHARTSLASSSSILWGYARLARMLTRTKEQS